DPAYPVALAALPDPPFGLFVRGPVEALAALAEAPAVAVVGCRAGTGGGLSFAHGLARDLAVRGAVVVSGLARGIDAAAHAGALEAGAGGVAVLGTGVDTPYPRRNAGLLDRMLAAGGVVVSEHWPGTPPAPWRFPARNRIVAGMCDAVVVVEAGRRSGALITADFALEAGRPVLAVPGFPGAACSEGCNALIRAGAAVCEGVDDVVAELPGLAWSSPAPGADPAAPEGLPGRVHERLRREPLRLDQLADALGVPGGEVAAALAHLEVEGLVVRGDAQRFWATPGRGAA
ncbi:MAG: DNA-processing protein DprA, partial [Actinomycetota bacterium]